MRTAWITFCCVFWLPLAGLIAWGLHQDSVEERHRSEVTTAGWNKWLTYRDQHCNMVEKMYGLSETSGKFHQNDNATVYECEGIKYVIAESVENAARRNALKIWQVPVVK